MSLVVADERTLKDAATDVWLGEHGDSSINLYLRPWLMPMITGRTILV